MPIITDFPLPASAASLTLPIPPNTPFFIAFLASVEPATGKPWCPDVVAALPVLHETFSAEHAPLVAFVEIGQKLEWRDPSNAFRTKWNLNAVPSLVRFEAVDGVVTEVGRLVEGEILDRVRLGKFISGREARI
ncbi:hypothetical protein BJX66DRAFT_314901 [Aspergillus keveii]|uniref:Thioredoxin domain-containing protein n=1 Tax=Aspergillus keveii TaxID=714993 RepID=A0ABR4FR10_9EURO